MGLLKLRFRVVLTLSVVGILLAVTNHFCGRYVWGGEEGERSFLKYYPIEITEMIKKVREKKTTKGENYNLYHIFPSEKTGKGIEALSYLDNTSKNSKEVFIGGLLIDELKPNIMNVRNFFYVLLSKKTVGETSQVLVEFSDKDKPPIFIEQMKQKERQFFEIISLETLNLVGEIFKEMARKEKNE